MAGLFRIGSRAKYLPVDVVERVSVTHNGKESSIMVSAAGGGLRAVVPIDAQVKVTGSERSVRSKRLYNPSLSADANEYTVFPEEQLKVKATRGAHFVLPTEPTRSPKILSLWHR